MPIEYFLSAAVDAAKVLPQMTVSLARDYASLKKFCRSAPMVDVVAINADYFNPQKHGRSDRLLLSIIPHLMAVKLPIR